MPPKLFSFIHFRKNASATPLVSHTFKTTIQPGMVVLSEHREPKDPSELSKAFRLIHFRKNASANPLASTLTRFTLVKSFTSNTYEKHTGGEGGGDCSSGVPIPSGGGITEFRFLIRADLQYPPPRKSLTA